MNVQHFSASCIHIPLGIHLEIFCVLGSKRSVISVEFMDRVDKNSFLPLLGAFSCKLIVVE